MHELGVVKYIIDVLSDIAKENDLSIIGSVTLEIGEVSGIIPEYITDCWQYYRKKEPLIDSAELKVEILPAVTICEDCNKTYETVKYGKICPFCNSGNTHLVSGNEFIIKEIEAI